MISIMLIYRQIKGIVLKAIHFVWMFCQLLYEEEFSHTKPLHYTYHVNRIRMAQEIWSEQEKLIHSNLHDQSNYYYILNFEFRIFLSILFEQKHSSRSFTCLVDLGKSWIFFYCNSWKMAKLTKLTSFCFIPTWFITDKKSSILPKI